MALYSPIGRPGMYSFEQVTQPDGTRWAWNPTEYRWVISGGTQANIRATTTPQQVANDLRGQGASPREIQEAVTEQVNLLTQPAQNFQFNSSIETALGNTILAGQSQITAETQILQQYAQGGLSTEARESLENSGELSRMQEYNQEFSETPVDVVLPPDIAPTPPQQRVQQPTPAPPPPTSPVPVYNAPEEPSIFVPPPTPNDIDIESEPAGDFPFTSDRFKKIDTDLPRVTIVNTYPVKKDRNKPIGEFLSQLRSRYKIISDGVEHTASTFTNPINQQSRLYNSTQFTGLPIPLPRPFGYIEPIDGSVVYRNLGDKLTQFRFQIIFTDSGNKYISKGLKDDIDYARNNGNPYFTSHLIPGIQLNKTKMETYIQSFKEDETRWGVTMEDSLSSGTQLIGEREVVQYIDSLLYDETTDLDNQFIKPFKRGTVISSHWFSQNPEGVASTGTNIDVTNTTTDIDTEATDTTSYGS